MSQSIEHLALFKQLITLSRLFEAKLMQALLEQGFNGLTMSFAEPMIIITLAPVRINTLATELGISKQLCNQTLKPLEQLNLITRESDPKDARAKLVTLTKRGKSLVHAAHIISTELQIHITQIVGEKQSHKLHDFLYTLSQGAQLPVNEFMPTIVLISLLSRYTERELMQLTMQQGFDFLQLSYSQVLNYISPAINNHISLSQLADINHVSLQAISRISRELEQHNIISKTNSAGDKRVKEIHLTDQGIRLSNCSINSAKKHFIAYEQWLNKKQLEELTQYLSQINTKNQTNTKEVTALKTLFNTVNTDNIKHLNHTDITLLTQLLKKLY